MLPQAALDQSLAQQRLVVATLGLTRREWAQMGSEFDASWAKVGPRITLLTASAQLGAARNGAASVPAILAELDQSVDPMAEVDPRGFAGIASDGRPLDSLLYGGVTTAKTAALTRPPEAALAVGGRWLDMAIHTAVADASRGAAGAAITTRQGIGWVRMVNPPSCPRCAVLAGKFFKWNEGFKRHPRCDCTHVATGASGAEGLTAEPSIDQITGLSKADKAALDNGADMNQVLNAKRGRIDSMTTSEGTTRRGQYHGAPQRLSPAGINRLASDRTEAVKLLRRFGYIL